MRTTIDMDDRVLRGAKRLAARRGSTLTSVLEDALREYLARQRASSDYTFKPVIKRGRILPGVDLNDRDRLHDVMDET